MSHKAIGNSIILKIAKKKSALDLSAMSSAQDIATDSKAVVHSLGTKCSLGLEVGHEVVVKAGTRPIEVESTEEHDLLLISETAVAYVTNWSES